MRVIRVAQVVRPAAGGIRRHVSTLLSRLDRSEFVSALFAPQDFHLDSVSPRDPAAPGTGIQGAIPGIPAIEHVPTAIGAVTSPLNDLRAIVQLSRKLRGNFDLVHAHGLRGALIGVIAARLAGIPTVFTAHNLVPRSGTVTRAALRCLCNTASVIAVSQAVADTLARQGVSKDRIQVVPNGIDVSEFDGPELSETARRAILANLLERAAWTSSPCIAAWISDVGNVNRPLFAIGAVGRLSPEKGFETLIHAFSSWSESRNDLDQPTRRILIIAGAGRDDAALRVAASGVTNVVLAGAIDNAADLLRAVDVVVIPSREEGQGIVALEAMAARKPVIASNVGGLPESVTDGLSGMLVLPGDVGALASALIVMEESPDVRRSMGSEGRKRVEQYFTLDAMIARLQELYRSKARSDNTRARVELPL